MKQTTRVVALLGPNDELRCSLCGHWKRANDNFRIQQGPTYIENAHKPSYFGWCHACEKTRSAMGTRVENGRRRLPTVAEVRAYLAAGGQVAAGTATAAKNKPATRHVPRDPLGDDREVKAALGVLRDARAQRRHLAQGYVYLISDGTAVKVGYSTKPEARVNELQTGNPRDLILLAKKEGDESVEAMLHTRFIDDNLILEWFRPSTPLLQWFGVRWDADRRLAWMKNARRTKT